MLARFRKVAIGISGGVDSAVSAFLLKERKFDVIGVFMKNWDIPDEIGHCNADADYQDARNVCTALKIPLIHVDFVKEYWNYVFSEFLSDYQSGLTPNPDILCNRFIKFDYFYHYAMQKLGVDAIATGHYAQTNFGSFLENYKTDKNVRLLQSEDLHKDQTFFLSQVKQEPLRKTMFPIGKYKKSKVRQIAKDLGLDVADKHDSTDKIGPFIDIETGKQVGTHLGLHYWTLGQGAKLSGYLKSYFIARKDPKSNVIYVVAGTDNPYLFIQMFYTALPHWIDATQIYLNSGKVLECQFRFQHTKPLINCQIYLDSQGLIVHLETPIRAITPGQYSVFYLDNQCLGSARIVELGPNLYTLNNFNDVLTLATSI